MRVIEPRTKRAYPPKPHKKKRVARKMLLIMVISITMVVFVMLLFSKKSSAPGSDKPQNQVLNVAPKSNKKGTLKTFTGAEFRDLYISFAHPNTAYINESTPITGNNAVDERIRKLAQARGYRIQRAPVSDAFRNVGDGQLLQERAATDWLRLKEAAAKENLAFGLAAGYRSAEDQKQIFLERLNQTGIPVQNIASGAHDIHIGQVLRATAIPGYSRHHSGYAVDIACKNDPNVRFGASKCFRWLSADNYKNAKTYGWIPSYPDGAGKQGPDPESWEYIWVGIDALTE